MNESVPGLRLEDQSGATRYSAVSRLGQAAAGFLAYGLVAGCVAYLGGLGSLAGMAAAAAVCVAFLAFVVRRHRRRGSLAFTVGVVTGVALTAVAFAAFLVVFGRSMSAFGA